MNYSNYEGQQDLLSDETLSLSPEFAGFWLRFAAYVIDTIVIYLFIFIIAIFLNLSPFYPASGSGSATEFLFLFLYFAVLMYFPIMESSKWQATLGKRAVGIQVTDISGARIGFGNALGRFFSKFLSALIFCFGFIMAGFTPKKQGLHDMIANTLVIKS